MNDIKQWWNDGRHNVRVMAIVENYIVARRKDKPPFVKSIKSFTKEFQEGRL